MNDKDTNKKKKKKIPIFVILMIALACTIVSGAAFVSLNYDKLFGETPSDKTSESPGTGKLLPIDTSAGDYVPPETSAPAPASGIAIPGWGKITIPADQKEVSVDFPNPEANTGKYYLTFELRLKDTGEVLYTSGLVPPGKHIQHITLSRELEKGTYKAVIHVQPYKMDQAQTPTNNANMETDLIVF